MRCVAHLDQVNRLGLASIALAVGVAPLTAQSASVAGRVLSVATALPLEGADVLLTPANQRVMSDSGGHFRFTRVVPGDVTLLVRLIGFSPASVRFTISANEAVDVRLELKRAAQSLDTVAVQGTQTLLERGKLADFYGRRRAGIGHFFDAELFEKEHDRQLGEIISSLVPPVRLVRSYVGGATYMATGRRSAGSFFGNPPALNPADRDSGADPRACYADVYVDGVAVYLFGNSPPNPLFDMNSISLTTVAAVELFVGPAEAPTQYNKTGSLCGVMLIWTK